MWYRYLQFNDSLEFQRKILNFKRKFLDFKRKFLNFSRNFQISSGEVVSGFLQFNDPLPPEEEMQALVLVRKDPTLAQIIIPMSPFQPFSIFSNIFASDRILLGYCLVPILARSHQDWSLLLARYLGVQMKNPRNSDLENSRSHVKMGKSGLCEQI